jgi:hypothetical protein
MDCATKCSSNILVLYFYSLVVARVHTRDQSASMLTRTAAFVSAQLLYSCRSIKTHIENSRLSTNYTKVTKLTYIHFESGVVWLRRKYKRSIQSNLSELGQSHPVENKVWIRQSVEITTWLSTVTLYFWHLHYQERSSINRHTIEKTTHLEPHRIRPRL